MYVLGNTGRTPLNIANYHGFSFNDFSFINNFFGSNMTANLVKHYGLCMGDYLSLYEDESKNLVSTTYFFTLFNNIITI